MFFFFFFFWISFKEVSARVSRIIAEWVNIICTIFYPNDVNQKILNSSLEKNTHFSVRLIQALYALA